jgi:Arc/MetJ-type ribon-helix-helix transcriptional regulator
MTVQKPRSRIISIRLSDEEYSDLRRLCMSSGARSVSDLARYAMRKLLRGTTKNDGISQHFAELQGQMSTMSSKIEQLSARFALPHNGNGNGH